MLVLAIGLCVKAGSFSFGHGIPQEVLLEKTRDAGVSGEPGSFRVPSWWGTYGWFFGVAIGGMVYYLMSLVKAQNGSRQTGRANKSPER